MPNLLEESKLFEWAGIYLGKDDTYLLYKSLIKLGIAKAVKSIRFWGKITSSKKDYFVAEG
jgi:radial spoke head protein 4A